MIRRARQASRDSDSPAATEPGIAESCTLGISAALERGSDFLLSLNNDAVVAPDFLGPLLKAASQHADAGLVSPQIVHLNSPTEAWYQGGTFSPWTGIPTQGHGRRVLAGDHPAREVDYATGCAMLIRPAVIQRVGPFEPRYLTALVRGMLDFARQRLGPSEFESPVSIDAPRSWPNTNDA